MSATEANSVKINPNPIYFVISGNTLYATIKGNKGIKAMIIDRTLERITKSKATKIGNRYKA